MIIQLLKIECSIMLLLPRQHTMIIESVLKEVV